MLKYSSVLQTNFVKTFLDLVRLSVDIFIQILTIYN